MIRLAEHRDAEAIADLIGMFVGGIKAYDNIPAIRDDSIITAKCWMEREGAFGYVQEKDGEVVGFISGVVEGCPWNLGILMGWQYAYYVHPCYRSRDSLKLMDAFEKHCKDAGATMISSGAKCNAEAEAMDKMLTRRGYEKVETHYLKGV